MICSIRLTLGITKSYFDILILLSAQLPAALMFTLSIHVDFMGHFTGLISR